MIVCDIMFYGFLQGVLTFTHVRVDEKNPNLQEVDELAYSETK